MCLEDNVSLHDQYFMLHFIEILQKMSFVKKQNTAMSVINRYVILLLTCLLDSLMQMCQL